MFLELNNLFLIPHPFHVFSYYLLRSQLLCANLGFVITNCEVLKCQASGKLHFNYIFTVSFSNPYFSHTFSVSLRQWQVFFEFTILQKLISPNEKASSHLRKLYEAIATSNTAKKNQEWTNQHLWKTASKKFEVIWSPSSYHITSNFLKAVFHKFYCPEDLPWNGD